MAFPAALALELIHNQFEAKFALHKFDFPSRTKTRLFALGGPNGKQFALIIGDLDLQTNQPMASRTVIVLPKCAVPQIDGVIPLNRHYKTSRLNQSDSKIPSPDNLGFEVKDASGLGRLLDWYATA